MKKFIFSTVVGMFAVASAAAASSLTQTQIGAVISMLRSFGAEESVITNVQTSLTGSGPIIPPTQWCHTFDMNLSIGYAVREVYDLHKALFEEGFSISADELETSPAPYNSHPWFGEFGESTASAVVGFQEKYKSEILTPSGLVRGTGYVGPATRKKLNQLYGCGVKLPASNQSTIKVLSPNGGEQLVQGQSYDIRWSAPSGYFIGLFASPYMPSTSSADVLITPTYAQISSPFRWTVPATIAARTYKIKAQLAKTGVDGGLQFVAEDLSDAPFSIVAAQSTDWQSLIPSIRIALKQPFPYAESNYPLNISETADITGDGVTEALISLGFGGAYTNALTVMLIENGSPVVARFKEKDGNISPVTFYAGSSVRNSLRLTMLPAKNVIYSGSASTNDYGVIENCNVDAYQWNASTKVFEYNAGLSAEIKKDFCK